MRRSPSTIVYDPSLVMLAFRQARYRAAGSPRTQRAVEKAAVRWHDDATPAMVSGGLPNHVGAAVGCAARYGVGALFLAAVGDVAAVEAEAQAEAELGRELSNEEKKTIEQAVMFAQAGVKDEPLYEWVRQQMPTTALVDAAMNAARSSRDAVLAAPNDARKAVQEFLKEQSENAARVLKEGANLVDKTLEPGKDVLKALTAAEVLATVLVIGGGLYYFFGGSSNSSRGRK